MKHQILADFKENNQLNIEKIIELYNPYIYTILKNCLSKSEDIEEILSDVFMILWKNYKNLDKKIPVTSYLAGITKNLIQKKYRALNLTNRLENIENYENSITDTIDIEFLIEQMALV